MVARARCPETRVIVRQALEPLAAVQPIVGVLRGSRRHRRLAQPGRQRLVLAHHQADARGLCRPVRHAMVVAVGRRAAALDGVGFRPAQVAAVAHILALEAKKSCLVVRRPHGPRVSHGLGKLPVILDGVVAAPLAVPVVLDDVARHVRRLHDTAQLDGQALIVLRLGQDLGGKFQAHVILGRLARHGHDGHQQHSQHLDACVGFLELNQALVLRQPLQRRARRESLRRLNQGPGRVQQSQQLRDGGHNDGSRADVCVAQVKCRVHQCIQPHASHAQGIQPHRAHKARAVVHIGKQAVNRNKMCSNVNIRELWVYFVYWWQYAV